jgi:hypothetical protein
MALIPKLAISIRSVKTEALIAIFGSVTIVSLKHPDSLREERTDTHNMNRLRLGFLQFCTHV